MWSFIVPDLVSFLLYLSFIPAKLAGNPQKYQADFYFRTFLFAILSDWDTWDLRRTFVFSFQSQPKHQLLKENSLTSPQLDRCLSTCQLYSTIGSHLIFFIVVYVIALHSIDFFMYLGAFLLCFFLLHYNYLGLCLHCYIPSVWHIVGTLF